jgi:hypothetical protein
MAPPKTANEQLEAAHRSLRRLRWRVRFGTWLTAIVGLLLLGLVAGYFTYGYLEIASLQDPEQLVSLVGNTVDDAIPQLRQRLEDEVKNNAKSWAQQASEQAVAQAPSVRESLEEYICKGTDALIDELEIVGETEFRRILTENRSVLEQAMGELDDEDEISEGTVVLLEEAMEKELKMSMEDQVQAVLIMLGDVNRNMAVLALGENLNPVQQCERRVLMLARRLQEKYFAGVDIKDLAPSALTETFEQLETERLQQQREEAAAKSAESAKGDAADSEKPKAEKPEADDPEAPKADEPEEPKADKPEEEKPAQADESEGSPAEDQEAEEAEAPKS